MERNQKRVWFDCRMVFVLILGFAARLWVGRFGHNYDFDSYLIVLDALGGGQNVYSSTPRYNYGPVWFNAIGIIYDLVARNQDAFRIVLVVFLSLIDAGIFLIIWKRFGRIAAGLFFLNPISIIITGYHNQFDNGAILLGMISVELFGDDFSGPLNWRKLSGLLLLGFSLMTKHILFAFPLWLAMKQEKTAHKIIVLLLPITVFVLGFFPYWSDGAQGIVRNVWFYESARNEYLYRLFMPQALRAIIPAKIIWLLILGGFAFYLKRRKGLESLLLYTSVLVWASPSIANQYLAIPAAFLAVFFNPFSLAYMLVGTWHLIVDYDGLHFPSLQQYADRDVYYASLVILLLAAFIWEVWGGQIRRVLVKYAQMRK